MINESQIIQDYQSGMTLAEIARQHGCHQSTISRSLRRNNIPSRSKKEASQLLYGRLEALDESQIIRDYQSGLSTIEIARQHGCHHVTVSRILKRNNIPSRALKKTT